MDVDEESNSPWIPALLPVIEDLRELLPVSLVNCIPIPFYLTFWQLSLYDIYVPRGRYIDEIRIQQEAKSRALVESNRPDIDSAGRKRALQDASRASLTIDMLRNELNTHSQTYNAVRKRLDRERKYWFPTCMYP